MTDEDILVNQARFLPKVSHIIINVLVFEYEEVQLTKVGFAKTEMYWSGLQRWFRCIDSKKLAILLTLIAAFMTSFKAIFVKFIYLDYVVSPEELLLVRLALCFPFYFFLLNSKKLSPSTNLFTGRFYVHISILGFLGYYLASISDLIGLQYISASLERIILFSYPTFVLLFSAVVDRSLPSRGLVISSAMCYLGLAISVLTEPVTISESKDLAAGIVWVMVSAMSFAAYYVVMSRSVKSFSGVAVASGAGMVAFVYALIHQLISNPAVDLTRFGTDFWVYMTCIAVFCTVLPSFMLSNALKHLSSGVVANLGAIGPIITMVGATIFLGEQIQFLQVVGMAFVVLSVSFLSRHSKKS